MNRAVLSLFLVATTIPPALRAQAAAVVSVEGLAYDSLMRRPLPDAMIAVEGTGRSAISDAKGRFRLDSVPEGTRVFMMQHAAFDSLGLSGVSVRVTVQRKMSRVVFGVPSFETLWRAACGDQPAPRDSALVFGTVRDAANLEPTSNAMVEGAWVDLVGGGKSLTSIGQRRWRRTAATDARGEYALCGVPVSTALTLRAAIDTARVTSIELAPTAQRVQRRDLMVSRAVIATAQAARPDDTTRTDSRPQQAAGPSGVVAGIVTNASGMAVANAAVAVDTMAEVRTGEDGRFLVRDVPIGTRQLSIVAIGMTPYTATFDLREGDTAKLVIPMSSVQTLSEVSVKATATGSIRERGIDERKMVGLGYFRDSTFIASVPYMASALRAIPGVIVSGHPYRPVVYSQACSGFRVYQDGQPILVDELGTMDLRSIAQLEIYTRNAAPADVPGGRGCAILVWTKAGLGKQHYEY